MRRIFKYSLQRVYRQLIGMPRGAEILSVQAQFGEAVIWAAVNPEQEMGKRIIYSIPTGEEPPDGMFLGTIQFNDGAFVLHVFEGTV